MTNIEVNEIREYAAQRGYALRRVEIREDNSCYIKIKKIDAASVGVWETEFGFSDFQTFKKEFLTRTKLIRENGRKYVKKIRAKDNKNLREIKKYKKNNIRAKNMQSKYTDVFTLAFEQIKDSFESHDDKCSDILECYSEHYLSTYIRILQNYWGVSRDANLRELDAAYKDVAKNVLFKYIVNLIRIYRENSDNEYKNKIFIPNAQLECAHILDRRYRLRYRRLCKSFLHMAIKSAEYVTSFGASHKKVSEKNFFSDYISVVHPSNYEEMSYNQLKSVILLCVNKNVENEKSKNKAFMFLPALGVGFEGVKNAPREVMFRKSEKATVKFTGGSIIKTVLPILTASLILTSSSLIKWDNTQDIAAQNPEYAKAESWSDQGLSFLPFGIGDLLEDKISLLANAISDSNVVTNANYETTAGDAKGMEGTGNKPGAVNFGILPSGQNGVQFEDQLEDQLSERENGGTSNNNGFGEGALQENPQNEAAYQASSPSESVPIENAPLENMQSDSGSGGNNPMKQTPQENALNESQPQKMASSENSPKENSLREPESQENHPQESTQNESEPKENAPSENHPQENVSNESEPQGNTPDEIPQSQTSGDLENLPTENIPEESAKQENPAVANQNAVQVGNSQPTYHEDNISSKDSDKYTTFTREDFNIPMDFRPNNLNSERPIDSFINKPPPGSLDRNGKPKKNPKTGR